MCVQGPSLLPSERQPVRKGRLSPCIAGTLVVTRRENEAKDPSLQRQHFSNIEKLRDRERDKNITPSVSQNRRTRPYRKADVPLASEVLPTMKWYQEREEGDMAVKPR